jgi:hypothetical protein
MEDAELDSKGVVTSSHAIKAEWKLEDIELSLNFGAFSPRHQSTCNATKASVLNVSSILLHRRNLTNSLDDISTILIRRSFQDEHVQTTYKPRSIQFFTRGRSKERSKPFSDVAEDILQRFLLRYFEWWFDDRKTICRDLNSPSPCCWSKSQRLPARSECPRRSGSQRRTRLR